MTTLLGKRIYFERWDGYNEIADIGLIRIKDDGTVSTLALSMANESPLEGEHILVIGNPEGMTGTVSDGMISANRDDEFQITAPISPGSSGSPVINDQGEVVGMVKGYINKGQNLNLCVPLMHIKLSLAAAGTKSQEYIVKEPKATVPSDHKELTPPTLPADTDKEVGQAVARVAYAFGEMMANGGKINYRLFAQHVLQWYDHNGKMPIRQVASLIEYQNRRWQSQHTTYDWARSTLYVIPNSDGWRNYRVDVSFLWYGTDTKGHTITRNGVMHIAIYESGAHNGWYVAAVCNGDQMESRDRALAASIIKWHRHIGTLLPRNRMIGGEEPTFSSQRAYYKPDLQHLRNGQAKLSPERKAQLLSDARQGFALNQVPE